MTSVTITITTTTILVEGRLVAYLDHHLCHLFQGLRHLYHPAGTTGLLPPPSGVEPSVPPYPREIPPTPDYHTFFTERIAVVDRNPNLRGNYNQRLVISVMPRVSEVEPSAPELPPEDQIRLFLTLGKTFLVGSDKEDENELPQPESTIPNFDK